ncbi:hypothetical protein [Salinicola sp. MH3R3-1]|uniref:hypothetical protein n=1 Tax=Salinicola sp. MH3R3-1 TaxID=1928762 RepID=UPI000A513596|nr:hypothetical protein [Salinicola sp. MH3R3-1]
MAEKNNEANVTVRLRDEIDLAGLESWHNKLSEKCGTCGVSIARQVSEGNGIAAVKLSLLPLAIDTHDGMNVLNSLFEFEDPKSRSPLLFRLLQVRRK